MEAVRHLYANVSRSNEVEKTSSLPRQHAKAALALIRGEVGINECLGSRYY